MKRVILVFLLLLYQYSVSAQAYYFEKIFGNSGTDAGRSVKQLSNGFVYVAGYSSQGAHGGTDFTLCKLDKSGNLLWMNFFGDALNNYGLCLNTCLDGNLILSGETETSANGKDAFLCKIDTSGNLIWYHTYGDSTNQSFHFSEATVDGGYISCGFTTDNNNSNNYFILKSDSLGNQLWTVNYGGSLNDYADMIHETVNGGFIITGDTNSDGSGGYDVEVLKLDSLGGLVWDSLYGDHFNNGCQGIIILKKGGYAIYGETETAASPGFDFFIRFIDTSGNTMNLKTFGGTGTDALFSLLENADGSFAFTGYSNSYNLGPLDLVIGKTDSVANMQWIQSYGAGGIDIGYQIIHAADSGYLVIGNTFQNASDDFYLLQVNDSGKVIGIKEAYPKNINVSLFPNPSNGLFTVSAPFASGSKIHLQLFSIDAVCVLLQDVTLTNNSLTINLTNIPQAGIYFLRLYNDKINCYSKVCIQK